MKKSGIYRIAVGLTVLINSCAQHQPKLQLLSHHPLRLPSASAVVFHQNKLWVFGDDAPYLSVLDTNYNEVDSIQFWPSKEKRIAKNQKPDIESAYLSIQNGKSILSVVSSQSAPARWQRFDFDVDSRKLVNIIHLDSTIAWPGISQRNIEGSCLVGTVLVTANRGNISQPQNHLLFWNDNKNPVVKQLSLPKGEFFTGVSDIYYEPKLDILFLTASEEATTNAFDDGAIGESYLGWITDFSKQMNATALQPDEWLHFSKIDRAFAQQKIEGVCVEKINGKQVILDLVSDNDGKASQLFRVRLDL